MRGEQIDFRYLMEYTGLVLVHDLRSKRKIASRRFLLLVVEVKDTLVHLFMSWLGPVSQKPLLLMVSIQFCLVSYIGFVHNMSGSK